MLIRRKGLARFASGLMAAIVCAAVPLTASTLLYRSGDLTIVKQSATPAGRIISPSETSRLKRLPQKVSRALDKRGIDLTPPMFNRASEETATADEAATSALANFGFVQPGQLSATSLQTVSIEAANIVDEQMWLVYFSSVDQPLYGSSDGETSTSPMAVFVNLADGTVEYAISY